MQIYGVSFDMVGKQPIVLLKTVDGNKFLPIWIGHPEAAAILMKLQGANTPRPMTHDLINDVLSELEVSCTKVTFTRVYGPTSFSIRMPALTAAMPPPTMTMSAGLSRASGARQCPAPLMRNESTTP